MLCHYENEKITQMKRKARRKALIGSCIFSIGTAGYYLMGIYNQNTNEENTTIGQRNIAVMNS